MKIGWTKKLSLGIFFRILGGKLFTQLCPFSFLCFFHLLQAICSQVKKRDNRIYIYCKDKFCISCLLLLGGYFAHHMVTNTYFPWYLHGAGSHRQSCFWSACAIYTIQNSHTPFHSKDVAITSWSGCQFSVCFSARSTHFLFIQSNHTNQQQLDCHSLQPQQD